MASTERRPLFTCSPWALLFLLLLAAAWISWRLARPLFGGPHDPEAGPRLVAARGDLAEDERATIELFRQASRSVVHITTWERRYARDRFLVRPLDIPQGMGSGFVWDEDGYVVTNVHVIQTASRALVTLPDGSEYEGLPVGGDTDFDIAVLKIDAPREKLFALPLGSSKELMVGQKVFAIGNPFGLDNTLTTGIISGLEREILADARSKPIRGVIQTDAAINPGNSGGPLLDSAGRLIGVNTAIYSTSGASAGIGFAVPVDTINKIVPSLVRTGSSRPPILGVTIASGGAARRLGVDGLVIESVLPGSGAEKAGLRSWELSTTSNEVRADVIVAIEDQRVEAFADIKQALLGHRPGDAVELEILRDGRPMTVEVVLQ